MKEVNRLALPAILANIAEPIIALVDTAFIGHIGTEALGGIGIGSSLFLLFIWVLTQTKTAISAIVSRHYGAQTLEKIQGLIPQVLFSVLILGLIVAFLTDYFSLHLLRLYSAEGQVLEQADKYFSIRSKGFPLVLCTYTIFGIFRGIQNTSWAMIISISAAVLNVILDVVLIFGIEGVIPKMGIEGAAWASLMAQAFMLICAIILMFKKTPFRFRLSNKLHSELKYMLGLSSGFIIRTLALNVTFFLANRYATSYGDEYIAAHTIAVNIWLFSSYFIDGYANAGNALSGRLLGSGNTSELFRIGKKLMFISIGIGGLLGFFYLSIYPWIGSFFSEDLAVLTLFNSIFWIVIVAQPLNAIAFSFDGVFKGLGRAKFLMNTLLIASFLGFLPLLILGDYLDWGLYGIWMAFVLFMLIRALTLFMEFRKSYFSI
ncbi:MAG: MATE family efflux transporter [Flavobacteriales bacterium]|nr:MATE family efflux transporter [Flavobacteriales bacterium]NNK80539.1 MATE family efflux transporter [Flavobacteriales bacterium]